MSRGPESLEETIAVRLDLILKALKRELDDWKEKIPKDRKSSLDEDNAYKVRNCWFTSVSGRFQQILEINEEQPFGLPNDLKSELEDFNNLVCTFSFSERDKLDSDIKAANNLIKKVLDFFTDK